MSSFDQIFDEQSLELLPLDVTATSHYHGDGRHSHSDDCVPPPPPMHAFCNHRPQFLNPQTTYHSIPYASHDDNCLNSNSCFVTGSLDTTMPFQVNDMLLRGGISSEQPPSLTRDHQLQYGSLEEEERTRGSEPCGSGCSQDGAACEEDCKEPCEKPCVIDDLCGE